MSGSQRYCSGPPITAPSALNHSGGAVCNHRFIYPKDTGTIGFGPGQLLGENANWAAQAPLVATIDAMGLPEAERFAFSCAHPLLFSTALS